MIKWLIGAGLVFAMALSGASASAISIKMQPLMYKDTLAQGEKKKGFVDISNPSGQKLHLRTNVQGFRQINDQGGLEFFDDAQIAAGLIPDLAEVELGPREALRMYFLLDGTKLPSGDVFAGLFVSTVPDEKSGVGESVRLGTLFSIVNGTPGSRRAAVTGLDVGFWQFGDGVNGSFTVKNTAQVGLATGFFPTTTIALGRTQEQQKVASKLVFAGRSRQNDFQLDSSRLGLYKISASYGDSKQEKWVFMVTGYWRIIVLAAVLFLFLSIVWWRYHRRSRKRRVVTEQG